MSGYRTDVISPRVIASFQGAYYVATGLWAIVHRESFERVTGPKRDYWLVRTVGGLAVAIGVTLGVSAAAERRSPEAAVIGVASGIAFGLADLQAAVASSRVYLGDAALHALLVSAWLASRSERP
jgi:hypothetical protein